MDPLSVFSCDYSLGTEDRSVLGILVEFGQSIAYEFRSEFLRGLEADGIKDLIGVMMVMIFSAVAFSMLVLVVIIVVMVMAALMVMVVIMVMVMAALVIVVIVIMVVVTAALMIIVLTA